MGEIVDLDQNLYDASQSLFKLSMSRLKENPEFKGHCLARYPWLGGFFSDFKIKVLPHTAIMCVGESSVGVLIFYFFRDEKEQKLVLVTNEPVLVDALRKNESGFVLDLGLGFSEKLSILEEKTYLYKQVYLSYWLNKKHTIKNWDWLWDEVCKEFPFCYGVGSRWELIYTGESQTSIEVVIRIDRENGDSMGMVSLVLRLKSILFGTTVEEIKQNRTVFDILQTVKSF